MSGLRIGFVGAGNMANAIVRGLLSSKVAKAENIIASSPPADKILLDSLEALGCRVTHSNAEATEGNDVAVLAVKPNIAPKIIAEMGKKVNAEGPLIASVVMGITCKQLESALQPGSRVVRFMPNTPASLQQGASVYCRGTHATDADARLTELLLKSIGSCDEALETHFDAVTGLSGAGPAYTCVILEALADGGVKMGLPRTLAMKLAAQTVMGSAGMVLQSDSHPGQLKDSVCSPGGCSIAGVSALEVAGVRGGLISAVEAATKKATEAGRT